MPRYNLRESPEQQEMSNVTTANGLGPLDQDDSNAEEGEDACTIEAWAAKEDRKNTMELWQRMWSAAEVGQKTRLIIPPIVAWIDWGPDCLTYRLTQYILGHHCYAKYMHRVGTIRSSEYWHCPDHVDDAYYTIVFFPEWEEEREVYCSKWGMIEGSHQIK